MLDLVGQDFGPGRYFGISRTPRHIGDEILEGAIDRDSQNSD